MKPIQDPKNQEMCYYHYHDKIFRSQQQAFLMWLQKMRYVEPESNLVQRGERIKEYLKDYSNLPEMKGKQIACIGHFQLFKSMTGEEFKNCEFKPMELK